MLMFAAIGQYIGGKVVTAILVVAVGGAGIWFWKHPDDLRTIWQAVKYAVAWIGIVLVLPWATFFVTPWIVSKDSNTAALAMLLGYLMADIVVALWMMGTLRGHETLTWMVLILGFLAAAVYNLKACEFQADRAESG